MSVNFSITLVVPILNEADTLPELLDALKAQSHLPDEIIFCDAGSSDGSQSLINEWWSSKGWAKADCKVINLPGALPGEGRNVGIKSARNNWIAFIDGGITPAHDWLEELSNHAIEAQTNSVFGVCHFSAALAFQKAVCALSYGHGSEHSVIPASLFKRTVFEQCGFFPANLRAGEDILWEKARARIYGAREICQSARVTYTHFPKNWKQAFCKWRVSELHSVKAGIRRRQQLAYLVGVPILCGVALSGTFFGYWILFGYFLLRGIIDPIRRSPDFPWWGNQPTAAVIAIFLALAMDIAKWMGITQGITVKIAKKKLTDGSSCAIL